jgi:DNA-binding response OmpR family regulator
VTGIDGHRPSALVAEDDPEMRALIAEALRQEGYAVDEAEDGRRMWIMTLASAHDLVVSDLRLPIVDGLTVLEDLRCRDPSASMILMTAFGDGETRSRAERLGAVFLNKPFKLGELRAAARRVSKRFGVER